MARIEQRCNAQEAEAYKALDAATRKLYEERIKIEPALKFKQTELKKMLGGFLTPSLMLILDNPNASFCDLISAAAWDVTGGIDPTGLTDIIEGSVGLDDEE